MNLIAATALEAAVKGYGKALDRHGVPAIFHPMRVGMSGQTPDAMAVGFLHDIIEDGRYTAGDLRNNYGLPHHIIDAVIKLTHFPGVPYDLYIGAIGASNRLVIGVKQNDLLDNLARDDSDGLRKRHLAALNTLVTAAKTLPQYTIVDDGKGFLCRTCGKTSHNANDVKNLFCGYCKVTYGN